MDKIKDITNNIQNKLSNITQDFVIKIIMIIILITIIILLALLSNNLSKNKKNCKKLDIYYKDISSFKGIDNNFNNLRFKDLHIITAYNCCNAGEYKNNYVNLCALEKCINLGIRCLDFQVFSLHNNPIVSSSTLDKNYVKETYNYLHLKEVFEKIANTAFNSENISNNEDPLILHIRVMSSNPIVYTKLIEHYINIFNENANFKPYKKYNIKQLENNNRLYEEKILNLKNKVILIIKPYQNFNLTDNNINTNLLDYVNLVSLPNNDNVPITDFNKCLLYYYNTEFDVAKKNNNIQLLSIFLPEYENNSTKNSTIIIKGMQNGCSLIGIKIQSYDVVLHALLNIFEEQGNYAFMEKNNTLQSERFNSLEKLPDDEYTTSQLRRSIASGSSIIETST